MIVERLPRPSFLVERKDRVLGRKAPEATRSPNRQIKEVVLFSARNGNRTRDLAVRSGVTLTITAVAGEYRPG
jgi:hypothetical protein